MSLRVNILACSSALAVILAMSPGARAQDDGIAAEQITVTAGKSRLRQIAATKSSLPLAETPQSVSVISAQDISKFGLANLDQTLRYAAGVTTETRGAEGEIYDLFMVRGFQAPIYLDGLKEFVSATGYADPQIDVSRIEDIEIIKGPASALYGQSPPGGLVAITSKLPLDRKFYGNLSTSYGSYGLYREDADVGGRINDIISARLYGSVNGANTEQYFGRRQRDTVSLAITARFDPQTSLTLLEAYSHDPYNGDYSGVPASGTLFHNPNGTISTRYSDGEPGDYFRREQNGETYIFNRGLPDGWNFRASGRYQQVGTNLGAIYEYGIPDNAAENSFARGSYATREEVHSWSFDNQISGSLATGPVIHHILLGLDRQAERSYELAAFGSADDIDAFNPVYGTQPVPQSPYGAGVTPYVYDAAQRQTGLYAQDELAWQGLRLVLSGRQDWADTISSGEGSHDQKFTYRAGALYKTAIGLAPYVSYATSFEPQTGEVLNADGSLSAAKPDLGKQIEIGAKYQPASGTLITLSLFHIEQTNVLTTIPNSYYGTQSGKVRSRGIEIEGNTRLPYDFALRFAYSRQSVKDIADADPAKVGQSIIGAGKGNATINLDWQPALGRFAGLDLGLGIRHLDSVYGGAFSSDEGNWTYTPAYTLLDANGSFDLARLDRRLAGMAVRLNIANLLDKRYLASCYSYPGYDAWCWYGNRRTVQGSIDYHW